MSETAIFPRAGVRARRWRRFEDGLHTWLETQEGRFAVYCAELDRTTGPEPDADRPMHVPACSAGPDAAAP